MSFDHHLLRSFTEGYLVSTHEQEIEIDYDLSFKSAVEAGRYDTVDQIVNEFEKIRKSKNKHGKERVKLALYSADIPGINHYQHQEVMDYAIQSRGQHAGVDELLAFAANNANIQALIFALGAFGFDGYGCQSTLRTTLSKNRSIGAGCVPYHSWNHLYLGIVRV